MQFSQLALFLATTASSVLASPLHVTERASTELVPDSDDPTRFLFVFGDSYTTTGSNINGTKPSCSGNKIGNPTFPGSTTDNGVNWIGQITETAPDCTLAYNFAFFGATVNETLITTLSPAIPSFIDQVKDFEYTLAKHPSYAPWTMNNTAATVWFGVNDVANSYQDSNAAQVDLMDLSNYFTQLSILYKYGIRKFLLLNTPPVDRTPAELGGSTNPALKSACNTWNSNLSKQAKAWSAKHAGSVVKVLSTHTIFEEMLNNPTKYGAPNDYCYNSDGTSCLWWNSYHPGQAIQLMVGKIALNTLKSMGFYAA